jgi:NMT1-like family
MRQELARGAGRWRALAASIVLVMTAIGCSRGPDTPALRAEVQGKLDQRFKPGLFELVGLRRQGSAPLSRSEAGAQRLAVYFSATLKLTQGYDFGNWEGLSAGTLAQVLGAAEKGLLGVKAGESRPGELIRVTGAPPMSGRATGGKTSRPRRPASPKMPAPGDAAPSSRAKQLIDRLAALVDTPTPGIPPSDEEMISEELDHALRAITARRERREHVYPFASGPEGGEYYLIAESVIARVSRLGGKVKVGNLATQGSVENARLIGTREADYALIQSNVAAMAFAGEGPSPKEAPSRRSGPSAACCPNPCTSSSPPPRESGRSRTSAASAWRSGRGTLAPGPMRSRSSRSTDSR